MTEPSTTQNVKQSMRTMSLGFSERMKTMGSSSKSKDIDVAVLKSTSARFHVVPKEKHVATLKMASSGSRASANYIASALLKRLHSATDWLTALKTLIVIHRLIRETDAAAFMEEMLRVGEGEAKGRGGRVLAMDNFLDTTNIEGRFDYSEWVRAYAKYLDEQLEVFSAVAWHVDLEGAGKESRLRTLTPSDLLRQLPYLQRLQRSLVDCVPKGQAMRDDVVLLSLSLVVRESFRLYKALSEGIINLADAFFSFEYLDALKGLEVYREAISSGEALSTYYTALQQVDAVKRAMELPQLEPPPADFLESMETYAKEQAPRGAAGEATTSAEGGAAVAPKRTAPLRKGRQSQPQSRVAPMGSADFASRDLGMLLPPGAEKATSPTTEPPAEEEQVQEELAPEPEPEPAPAPPVLDLLGFDEAASHIAPGEGEAAAPEGNAQDAAPAPPPSALDLLSELDFGALSIGPPPPPAQGNGQHPGANGGSTSAAQSAPGYWTSGGIPDAFVLHAASDVYGLPPAAGTPPQPHQQTSGYGHAQPGYYQQSQALVPVSPGPYGQPAPWGMQPQQAQQQQFYPSHQSGGGMALTPPGMPLASPGASPQFVYGMQGAVPAAASPWTASAPTPTGQRDPELFRQAGAHDPFISLTGVQQGQGGGAMKPSPR